MIKQTTRYKHKHIIQNIFQSNKINLANNILGFFLNSSVLDQYQYLALAFIAANSSWSPIMLQHGVSNLLTPEVAFLLSFPSGSYGWNATNN